jgi:hypothetical protein
MSSRRSSSANSWIYVLAHFVLFLVGYLMVRSDGRAVQNIGASLMAAAIAGLVVFVYVLRSESTARRLEILNEFGFVSAFEGRAARIKPEYDRRLQGAHKRIDVIGFGLRALWDDYHTAFPEWRERADVRILLMDPDSPYADKRDREENDLTGNIRQGVQRFIRDTASLRRSPGNHEFQIRLYTCLPSVNIFRVDDDLFWGPYLVKEQSRNAPTIIVRSGGILFGRLTEHFDKIWNDNTLSRPIRETDAGADA